MSELRAGWYRYVSRWRFHDDGTIRPRFGFSALQNARVCNVRHHHVYRRLDFDICAAENNVVRELNSPPIFPPDNWHTFQFEARCRRQLRARRRVDPLRFDEGQVDDGISAAWSQTGPSQLNTPADIGRSVNGESIVGRDVVAWYAAHFTHDVREEEVGHIVGPPLRPLQW